MRYFIGLLTVWAWVLGGTAVSYGGDGAKGVELLSVPTPVLDHLEDVVADQLRESRRMIDTIGKKKGVAAEDKARSFGEMGRMYHAYEIYDAAEASYRNAVLLFPEEFKWQYSLAYVLQEKGRYAEAAEHYLKVIELVPDGFLAHLRAGECYRRLHETQKARKYFEAALARKPGEPAILARMGELALGMKEFEVARRFLSSALEREPGANRLHYPLAMAYRGLGDMEKARHHLKKRGIVGIQPHDPLKKRLEALVTGYRVRMLAGRLAFDAGRFEEAAGEFAKAVEEAPDQVAAWVNLGTVLGKLGRYRKAVAHFEKARELDGDSMTIRFNLGSMQAHLGDFKGAISHLSAVCDADPGDGTASLMLGEALLQEDRVPEAFGRFQAAAAADPSLERAWLGMGGLLIKAGRHGEALEVLETARRNLPLDGGIAHGLARLLASAPDRELRDGERALMLAGKVWQGLQVPDHALTAAMALAELGRCDEAASWQERAVDMAVKAGVAPSVLGALNRGLDHYRENRPCRVP